MIRVVIEAHSQVISDVGFSQHYRNGAYEFSSDLDLQQWLSGNPRIKKNSNNVLYHLDYPGIQGYVGYIERGQ